MAPATGAGGEILLLRTADDLSCSSKPLCHSTLIDPRRVHCSRVSFNHSVRPQQDRRGYRDAEPRIGAARSSVDKLAANYLAFLQLAPITLWLRVNESTP